MASFNELYQDFMNKRTAGTSGASPSTAPRLQELYGDFMATADKRRADRLEEERQRARRAIDAGQSLPDMNAISRDLVQRYNAAAKGWKSADELAALQRKINDARKQYEQSASYYRQYGDLVTGGVGSEYADWLNEMQSGLNAMQADYGQYADQAAWDQNVGFAQRYAGKSVDELQGIVQQMRATGEKRLDTDQGRVQRRRDELYMEAERARQEAEDAGYSREYTDAQKQAYREAAERAQREYEEYAANPFIYGNDAEINWIQNYIDSGGAAYDAGAKRYGVDLNYMTPYEVVSWADDAGRTDEERRWAEDWMQDIGAPRLAQFGAADYRNMALLQHEYEQRRNELTDQQRNALDAAIRARLDARDDTVVYSDPGSLYGVYAANAALDEVKTYAALMGISYEEAQDEVDRLSGWTQYQEEQEYQRSVREKAAGKGGGIYTVKTWVTQPFANWEARLATWGSALSGEDLSSADPMLRDYLTNQNIRQERAQVWANNPALKGKKIFGQDAGAYIYNTINSMVDSWVNRQLMMGATAGLGIALDSTAGKVVGALVSDAVMGSGAAAQTYIDYVSRGYSPQQALAASACADLTEAITEWIGGEAVMDRIIAENYGLKGAIKQFMSEGLEELAGNWVNDAFQAWALKDPEAQERIWDRVQALTLGYVRGGMNPEKALEQALKDTVVADAGDFVAGGLAALGDTVGSRAMRAGSRAVNDYQTGRQMIREGYRNAANVNTINDSLASLPNARRAAQVSETSGAYAFGRAVRQSTQARTESNAAQAVDELQPKLEQMLASQSDRNADAATVAARGVISRAVAKQMVQGMIPSDMMSDRMAQTLELTEEEENAAKSKTAQSLLLQARRDLGSNLSVIASLENEQVRGKLLDKESASQIQKGQDARGFMREKMVVADVARHYGTEYEKSGIAKAKEVLNERAKSSGKRTLTDEQVENIYKQMAKEAPKANIDENGELQAPRSISNRGVVALKTIYKGIEETDSKAREAFSIAAPGVYNLGLEYGGSDYAADALAEYKKKYSDIADELQRVFDEGISERQQRGEDVAQKAKMATAAEREQRRTGVISSRNVEQARQKGRARTGANGISTVNQISMKNLSRVQRDMILMSQVLSKSINTNIVYFDSRDWSRGGQYATDENGHIIGANGWWDPDTNTIYLDINAGMDNGGSVLFTLSHEITHMMRTRAFDKYQELENFVTDYFHKNAVKVKIGGEVRELLYDDALSALMAKGGFTRSEDAREELVAQACEDMLTNSEAVKDLVQQQPETASFMKRAIDRFVKLWDAAIRRIGGQRSNSRYASQLRESSEALHRMQELWDAALMAAAERTDSLQPGSIEAEAVDELGRGAKVETNDQGELLVAESADGSAVVYSQKTWEDGGRDKLIRALQQNGHTDAEIRDTVGLVDDALDYLNILAAGYAQNMGYTALRDNLLADITTDIKRGKQVLSTLVKNGDYPVNLDVALICKKRVAYMELMQRLIEDGIFDKVDFGGEAIAAVNGILRDEGFETACLGCFVESRRLQLQAWAETIVSEWNAAVDKRVQGAGDFGFARGAATYSSAEIMALQQELENAGKKNAQGNLNLGQGSVAAKMGRLMDRIPSLRKHLTVADLLTPDGLKELRRTDGTLFSLVLQRYGAASPKIVQSFNPYNGEIAQLTFAFAKQVTNNAIKGAQSYLRAVRNDSAWMDANTRGLSKAEVTVRVNDEAMRRYLYDIGGARMQSFSDFMIENVFDYLQIFADLSAKRNPMHGYSKEAVCLRLFGMTGAKWNGSLIAHVDRSMGKEYAGLLPAEEAKNGNGILVTVDGKQYAIAFDDFARNQRTGSFIQSIGMKDIIALQMDPRYSANVGSITIGVSDRQILAMLESDLFRMVIPYHSSGMLPQYAKLVGVDLYNDYTDYQNTTVRQYYDVNGNAVDELRDANGKTVRADTSYAYNAEVQRTGDARRAADNYIAWCAQRHAVKDSKGRVVGYATFNPKFSSSPYGTDFTRHPNYYKLLEDFNSYDSITGASAVQGPVTMTLPSEATRLSEADLEAYKARLRETGIFSEREIERYAQKAQMTFKEIIDGELRNRAEYHKQQQPKWESTVAKVEETLTGSFARANENAAQGGVKFSVKLGMTEAERYEELKDAVIYAPTAVIGEEFADTIRTLEEAERIAVSQAVKAIRPIADKLGLFGRKLTARNLDAEFIFSKNGGFNESLHRQQFYGGSYADFLKALINLDKILAGAELIEQHSDKYAGTARENEKLDHVSVLMGLFRDGEYLVPVLAEIKDLRAQGGRLYLTVTMTKIKEADVVGRGEVKDLSQILLSASEYKLADIIAQVNTSDGRFLKYIPDQMLSDEQRTSKADAIAEDATKIANIPLKTSLKQRDADYLAAVERGDMETAQRMVDEAAIGAGAQTLLGGKRKPYYHGTAAKFTVFDIDRAKDGTYGYGFYFSPMRSKASDYGDTMTVYLMTDRVATRENHNITAAQVRDILQRYGAPLDMRFNTAGSIEEWVSGTDDVSILTRIQKHIQSYTDAAPADVLRTLHEMFGYDGLRSGNETVIWDNRLIKSADPVTYDDDGNVIPLSERFNLKEEDIRYSLKVVDPVQPSTNAWQRGHDEAWFIENGYPIYRDVTDEQAAANEETGQNKRGGKHGTQITSTQSTYQQVYDLIRSQHPNDWRKLRILDASSGIGLGTRIGRERGFNVTDIEPYPSSDRYQFDKQRDDETTWAARHPDYTDYSRLEDLVASGEVEGFDYIISNAVLNVIPQDTRDNLTVAMGHLLKPGGQMFVNVISRNYQGALDSSSEVQRNAKGVPVGSVRTAEGDYSQGGNVYGRGHETFVWKTNTVQKVFSYNELTAYLRDALGAGYTVEPFRSFGMTAAMVTKETIDNRNTSVHNIGTSEERRTNSDKRRVDSTGEDVSSERDGGRGRTQSGRHDSEAPESAANQYRWDVLTRKQQRRIVDLFKGYAVGNDLVDFWIDSIRSGYSTDSEARAAFFEGQAKQFLEMLNGNRVLLENDGRFRWLGSDLPAFIEDVEKTAGGAGDSSGGVKLSQKDRSDREVLSDALMEAAQTEEERSQLREYQMWMKDLDAKQERLQLVNKKIKEISFGGGQRDSALLKTLTQEAAELKRTINRYDKKLLNLEAAEPLKAVLQRERDAAFKAAAERGRKRLQAYRIQRDQSAAVKKYRGRIESDVKDLLRLVTENSDKRHVPDQLRQPLAEFLKSIDVQSAQASEGGPATRRDQDWARRFERLTAALNAQRADELEGKSDANLYLPDYFYELMNKAADAVRVFTERYGGTELYGSDAETLRDLSKVLQILNHAVKQANQTMVNNYAAKISELGELTMEQLRPLGTGKTMNRAEGWLNNLILWQNGTPYYVFKRFGEAGFSTFQAIMDGQGKLAAIAEKVIQDSRQMFTSEEVKDWQNEVHEVELSNDRTVRMTTAQIMSFYCLSKRQQAVGHLLGGGMKIDAFKDGRRTVDDRTDYVLGVEDIQTINGLLTDRQREVADAIQRYMSTYGSELGNEVSMRRFNYKAYGEVNYFPIVSDRQNLDGTKEEEQRASLLRLLNMSHTKSLVDNANNALVVQNIFDVFSNHMSDMAEYNALALPVLDMVRWFNYKNRQDAGNGQIVTDTVQKSLATAFGGVDTGGGNVRLLANEYVKTFLKDLNGNNERGRDIGIGNLMGKYKRASVAANLRVAIQQPMSIMRASAVLDPKWLAKGIADAAKAPREMSEELSRYSNEAKWKDQGHHDIYIGRSVAQQIKNDQSVWDRAVERSMVLAEIGDKVTWTALWAACKAEQQGKGLSGEALMDATARRFQEVVYATQVMDATTTRSQSMRSNSPMNQMWTAFMAEPTLSLNLLVNTWTQYRLEARRGGDTAEARKKAFRATYKVALRAIAAYSFNALAVTLAESLIDAFRDDDDYETFVDKYLSALGENWWEELDPLRKITVLKDVINLFTSKFGAGDRMDMAALVSVKDSVDVMKEWYAVKFKGADPTETTYYGKMTPYGKIYKLLKATSQITGIPFAGASREFQTVWNNMIYPGLKAVGVNEVHLLGQDLPLGRLKTYNENVKNVGIPKLYDALVSGNESEAIKLRTEMYYNGVEDKYITDQLKAQIKDHYTAGDIEEDEAKRMLVEYCGYEVLGTGEDSLQSQIDKWAYGSGYKLSVRLADAFGAADADAVREAVNYMRTAYYMNDSAIKSAVSSYWHEQYTAGADRALIRRMLMATRLYSAADVDKLFKTWDKNDAKKAEEAEEQERREAAARAELLGA